MVRIISGFAGSLALAVPPSGTRPTSDRVREAIFSALDARAVLDGARVADLYAGTGALGLEAASRGAGQITLVEKSPIALASCRKNTALVLAAAPRGVQPPSIEITGQAVQAFLETPRQPWDVVFLDPPYRLGEAEVLRNLATLAPRLAEGAVVLLERSTRDPEPAWPTGLELDRRKDYGDTALYWLSPA